MITFLKGRSLVSLHDLSGEEINAVLDSAAALKLRHRQGEQFLSLIHI